MSIIHNRIKTSYVTIYIESYLSPWDPFLAGFVTIFRRSTSGILLPLLPLLSFTPQSKLSKFLMPKLLLLLAPSAPAPGAPESGVLLPQPPLLTFPPNSHSSLFFPPLTSAPHSTEASEQMFAIPLTLFSASAAAPRCNSLLARSSYLAPSSYSLAPPTNPSKCSHF